MTLIGLRGIVLKTPYEIIKNGAVIIDNVNRTIIDVGEESILKKHNPEIVYDDKRQIIMPGLVNTHCHLAMTLFRGFPGIISGFEWLTKIWMMERALRPRHVYSGALMGLAHAAKCGITTVADHYYYAEETAKAAMKLKVRVILARTFMDLVEGPPGHENYESSLRFVREFKGQDSLISTMLGPHSLYTCSIESLSKIAEISQEYGIRLHIHLSESRDELQHIKKTYGNTPIKLADKIGLLENFPLLAHVAYADGEETDILAKKRVGIAYAPFTKLRGGQEISPAIELRDKGAVLGLATDGPTSVYSLDMFREMRMFLAAQNHKYKSPKTVSPEEALYIATLGGAKALGLDDRIGSLEPGKRADVIVLRPDSLKVHPLSNPVQAIVYGFSPEDVKYVFIDGELIVDNGKVTTMNEEEIIKEFDAALLDLKSEVDDIWRTIGKNH